MTTNKRQLGLTFKGILEAEGIDNLALEIRLTEAATRFFDETKAGNDPVKVRQNILDGILHFAKKAQSFEAMSERVEKALRLTPDGSDKWNDVIKWLIKKDEAGETIEQFSKWCSENPFTSPKPQKIAETPSLIKVTWPGAFVTTEKGTVANGLAYL